MQAIAEGSEDAEIGAYMTEHMREVHDVRGRRDAERAQAAGGIDSARDPEAEAWIFIALGLLTMADRVLGRVIGRLLGRDPALACPWLTGRDPVNPSRLNSVCASPTGEALPDRGMTAAPT